MTAAAIDPEPVPLVRDQAGRLMVFGTRVPLDTIVAALDRGDSPEAIRQSYPSLALGDIYALFTYCLRHREDVDAYLAGRAKERDAQQRQIESRTSSGHLRSRLEAARDV